MLHIVEEEALPRISTRGNSNANSIVPKTHEWRYGESLPLLKRACISVQADGTELHQIKSIFSNIPFSNGSVQVWKGEFAQFIYDNLY